MARSFRQGRFTASRQMGEDVNPSAYIVNLADCMLVLALGVIVSLVSFWQIDISPSSVELKEEQLEEVDPESMPDQVGEGGTYYEEAGVVYRDASTGVLYMIEETGEDAEADTSSAESSSEDASGDASGEQTEGAE